MSIINIYESGEQSNLTHLFECISSKLDFIIKQNQEMAPKQERFDAILTALNETTNEIADDYQKLLDEVRNGTVSDESLTAAEANIARLKAVAASNDQPVPGETIPPATNG